QRGSRAVGSPDPPAGVGAQPGQRDRPLPPGIGDGARAPGGRPAGVSAPAGRRDHAPFHPAVMTSDSSITIRSLGFSDLPQVIAIERRTFTTPWSLAMFVLELSKSSSVCLTAVDDEDRLMGYLICARYDRV